MDLTLTVLKTNSQLYFHPNFSSYTDIFISKFVRTGITLFISALNPEAFASSCLKCHTDIIFLCNFIYNLTNSVLVWKMSFVMLLLCTLYFSRLQSPKFCNPFQWAFPIWWYKYYCTIPMGKPMILCSNVPTLMNDWPTCNSCFEFWTKQMSNPTSNVCISLELFLLPL